MGDRVFFNDTAATEIYTLSLHDALPILGAQPQPRRRLELVAHEREQRAHDERRARAALAQQRGGDEVHGALAPRSEEHTSELQSRQYLVCRLLLEQKTNPSSYSSHCSLI